MLQGHLPSALFSEQPALRPRVTPEKLSTSLMAVNARRSSYRTSHWKKLPQVIAAAPMIQRAVMLVEAHLHVRE